MSIVEFYQILGVLTFIPSTTTCSSLSLFANGIAHLIVEAYPTSDCSTIPLLIFEDHSQAYIILIT